MSVFAWRALTGGTVSPLPVRGGSAEAVSPCLPARPSLNAKNLLVEIGAGLMAPGVERSAVLAQAEVQGRRDYLIFTIICRLYWSIMSISGSAVVRMLPKATWPGEAGRMSSGNNGS